jgi:hypothetical protein
VDDGLLQEVSIGNYRNNDNSMRVFSLLKSLHIEWSNFCSNLRIANTMLTKLEASQKINGGILDSMVSTGAIEMK